MASSTTTERETPAAPSADLEILLVGPAESPLLTRLGRALRLDGWAAIHLYDEDSLAGRIGAIHKAVVVLCAIGADAALTVLERLESKRHSIRVVVVVDHAEPGECYCLMQAGAIAYFEIDEDPVRILQGVEWAAHVLAP